MANVREKWPEENEGRGIAAAVTVRSDTGAPLRILGSLNYDESSGFRFTVPTVSLYIKTCLRDGDLVASGGRGASVVLTQKETAMTGSTELPTLAASESGWVYARVAYLGADLTERIAEADAPLPKDFGKPGVAAPSVPLRN